MEFHNGHQAQVKQLYDATIRDRTAVSENILLLIDGYHFYLNTKELRDGVFSHIWKNVAVPIPGT